MNARTKPRIKQSMKQMTVLNARFRPGVAASLMVLLGLTACGPAQESSDSAPAAEVVAPQETESVAAEASTDVTATAAFIPADFEPPVRVEGEGFIVVPLGPELVKIDYDAYMSSIEHLQTTFTRSTGWPTADIDDEAAMQDMLNEQGRFERRESFAYGVLTPDGSRERGCVYVRPSTVEGYDAVVRLWTTKAEFDAGFDAELYEWVQTWLQASWPFLKVAYPGRDIPWEEWDGLTKA